MSIFKQGCRKWDHLYNNDEKLCQSYAFSKKKGAYRIPGNAEKGTFRASHPYYVIYR